MTTRVLRISHFARALSEYFYSSTATKKQQALKCSSIPSIFCVQKTCRATTEWHNSYFRNECSVGLFSHAFCSRIEPKASPRIEKTSAKTPTHELRIELCITKKIDLTKLPSRSEILNHSTNSTIGVRLRPESGAV